MQSFFGDSNPINTASNLYKDSKSHLHTNPLGFSDNNSQYGFASSSSISNESSVHFNPESTLDMTPVGFTGLSQYGFDSSSSIAYDHENSNSYLEKVDSSKTQLTSDVYISYLLEGATTLSNSRDYGYHEDTKRDMGFDDEQSAGSGSSSNGKREMDLVEMMLSSQFSQGSNFLL
ncbi:hypothetical protein LXL04_005704 [Taraxacum kok-saghyz]